MAAIAPTRPRTTLNQPVVWLAGILLIAGAGYLLTEYSWRRAALYLTGGGLGLALYHAAFGFTSAWRVFIADHRGRGLQVQMLLLAITVVLFFPALNNGSLLGRSVSGFVMPLETSVLIGAFIFGIGMQLGGGCASGTLFTVGGGSTRMLITLAGFISGSVIATAHLHWWLALPGLPAISLIKSLGLWLALSLNLLIFAAVAGFAWWLERRYHGTACNTQAQQNLPLSQRLLRGPWPLVWGAVALALLNFITLALAGRPWGITSAFALWGAKIALLLGIDVSSWPYWSRQSGALQASVLRDVTSVMNFGIVLGAFLAAGLANKFAPVWRLPLASIVAAVVGGLMLGYGARLAFGCNIGAYFSGIASGSLHGWLWLIGAFAGNIIGTRLRPWFGLAVEHSKQRTG